VTKVYDANLWGKHGEDMWRKYMGNIMRGQMVTWVDDIHFIDSFISAVLPAPFPVAFPVSFAACFE